jgi:predicted transcriptional regulator
VTGSDQILSSLESRHAESILQGHKLVEFRRRSMRISPGTTLWIYAKVPVSSIVGCATVAAIRSQAPSTLWRKFGSVSGISRCEFFDYFEGINQGTALELSNTKRLESMVPLALLRRISAGFHPPQFFTRLSTDAPVLSAIAQYAMQSQKSVPHACVSATC